MRQSTATPRWWSDSEAIFVLHEIGAKQEAAAYAEEVLARLPSRSYVRGFVLASIGRFDDALPYLEQTPLTVQRRLFWAVMWDRWRNDAGFVSLIARLGRTNEYQRARATIERASSNPP